MIFNSEFHSEILLKVLLSDFWLEDQTHSLAVLHRSIHQSANVMLESVDIVCDCGLKSVRLFYFCDYGRKAVFKQKLQVIQSVKDGYQNPKQEV